MINHPLAGFGSADFSASTQVPSSEKHGYTNTNYEFEGMDSFEVDDLSGEEDEVGFGFKKFKKKFKKMGKGLKKVGGAAKLATMSKAKRKAYLAKRKAAIKAQVHRATTPKLVIGRAVDRSVPALAKKIQDFPRQAMVKLTTPKMHRPIETGIPQNLPNIETVAVPATMVSQTVVPAGNQLTAQNIAATTPAMTRRTFDSSVMHPLAQYSQPMSGGQMGEYQMGEEIAAEMGFSFSSFLDDIKKKVSTELKEAQVKLTTDVKARAGELIANTANKALQNPQIQQAMMEKGKEVAVTNLSKQVADQLMAAGQKGQELAKKAAIPMGVLAALGVGYYLYSKTMKKTRTA